MIIDTNQQPKSLINLIDDINEHLGKSLALGAMLTIDNVFSIDQELVEYYFGHIKDELWQIRTAWQQLIEYIPTQNNK